MTMQEYLTNPFGKGSSVMGSLSDMKHNLDSQYELLKSGISATSFIVNGKHIVYHVAIPSKTIDSLKYNVILQFELPPDTDSIRDINNLSFKCFSNCPSFTYTYGYVFKEKGLLCDWLSRKYDREVTHKAPVVKNNQKIIGFERSLYLACKYVSSDRRSKLDFIRTVALRVPDFKRIENLVRTQTEIEEYYNAHKNHEKKQKVEAEKKASTPTIKKPHTGFGFTKLTNTINRIKSSHSTTNTKTSHKTKKI